MRHLILPLLLLTVGCVDAADDKSTPPQEPSNELTDADGDVFINSKKTISVDSPEVGVTGTKVNLNATSDMNVSGGQTNIYTETGSAMFTSGQDPILSPSLLQTIINFADQAKARIRGFS